jgi:superfamily I DNA/RNA helicase
MNGARIALGEEFLSSYSRIPRKQQHKVDEFLKKFRQDPRLPGINLERINGAQDDHLYSIRIDQDYRGIVHKPDTGSTYILMLVDHHDEAYNWARRRRVSVHPETGCLQVLDIDAAESAAVATGSTPEKSRLFRKLKEKHLLQFGVPEEFLPRVRGLASVEDLEKLRGSLPAEAMECLEMFLADIELEEILRDVACGPADSVDTGDFDAALEKDGSKRYFYVVDDEEELSRMLAAPLEKWRVFLHPAQRRLVERDWNGPVRVLGGAGTGKTVVAMHRARWLAMNRFTRPGDRVLLTTFTKNLAADIRENLKSITPAEAMARIEVTNLDDWAWNFLKRNGFRYTMAIRKRTRELWDTALTLSPDGLEKSFFMEEWDRVILPQGLDTLKEYMTCSRTGRGTRLSRKQRVDIWPVFEEFRRLLDENGLREPADAMRDARNTLAANPGILPYRAVVVDEGQDMGPQELALIRQLALVGGDDTNSIFIVGDSHQRIYGRHAALGQAGIDIRGRGRKLRLNYRTTEETRNWAVRLLEGLAFDDLDAGRDDQKGYRSLLHGPSPEVHVFTSFDDEISFIVDRLVPLLSQPGEISSVCITARVVTLLDQYAAELSRRGIATCSVTKDKREDRSLPGVRLATLHRVKGLEFDVMIVAGVNRGVIPLPAAIEGSDEITRAEGQKSERALLYVAVTRARKQVLITAVEPVSAFLFN